VFRGFVGNVFKADPTYAHRILLYKRTARDRMVRDPRLCVPRRATL